jgi:hypothetical protein
MVADALPGGERIKNAKHDIVRVEMLLLHERQRRTLRSAFRRIGVAARRVGLGFRVRRPFHHALILMFVVSLEMAVPALCQIRIQLGFGRARRMNIAIGDRRFRANGRRRFGTVAELHVHGMVSFTAGCLRRL